MIFKSMVEDCCDFITGKNARAELHGGKGLIV
jgi:hypothetical protein